MCILSLSLRAAAQCGGLCRFGEAWAALHGRLGAENFTYSAVCRVMAMEVESGRTADGKPALGLSARGNLEHESSALGRK